MKHWRLRSASAIFSTTVFTVTAALRLPPVEAPPSPADAGARHEPSTRPSAAGAERSALARHAADLVDDYERQGLFRGAVLVSRKGEVVELQAGLADDDSAKRIQADSLFRIGSLSKHFAAAAALALEEQGRLVIADPVEKYLPDYPPSNLELGGKKVTLHHLLRHTSGLPAEEDYLRSIADRTFPIPAGRMVELIKHQPLQSVPGERYAYNNANYEVLALIIARTSGVSVEAFVRRLVARAPASDIGAVPLPGERSRLVRGYLPLAGGWLDIHRGLGVPLAEFPVDAASGNLFSSPRGLFDWFEGLVDGRVLGAASVERMLTPGAEGYGYGLVIDEVDGRRRVAHAGSVTGFISRVEYFPDANAALVVLSNGSAQTSLKQLTADLRALLLSDAAAQSHAAPRPLAERALASARSLAMLALSPTPRGVLLQALFVALLFLGFTPRERSRSNVVGAGIVQTSVVGIVLVLSGAGAAVTGVLALASAGLMGLGARATPGDQTIRQAGWRARARSYLSLAGALACAVFALHLMGRLAPFALGGAMLGALLSLLAPAALVSRYGQELERRWLRRTRRG